LSGCGSKDIDEASGVRFIAEVVPEKGGEATRSDRKSAVAALKKRFRNVKRTKVTLDESGHIVIEIPNQGGDPHSTNSIKEWKEAITRLGHIEFYMSSPHDRGMGNDPNAIPTPGTKLLPVEQLGEEAPDLSYPAGPEHLLVKSKPEIIGDEVKSARATSNSGSWGISLEFDWEGARKFFELSALHNMRDGIAQRGLPFAIVLDGVVISNPIFTKAISGESAQISGDFTESEAKSIASAITEPLPVTLSLISTKVIEKKD